MTITSLSPIVDANRVACLRWFTGSALVNATSAMDMLAASEAQGCWVPKASRRVDACFSKANVVIKAIKPVIKAVEAINDYRGGEEKPPQAHRGWEVSMVMHFSQWRGRGQIFWAYIMEKAPSDQIRNVVDTGRRFVADFAPLAALAARLDATRPLPVFTKLGVSPTLTSTLK